MPAILSPTAIISGTVNIASNTTSVTPELITEISKVGFWLPIAVSVLGFLGSVAFSEWRISRQLRGQRLWDLAQQYSSRVETLEAKATEYWTVDGNKGCQTLITEISSLGQGISQLMIPYLKRKHKKAKVNENITRCISEFRKAITGPDGFELEDKKAARADSHIIKSIRERGEDLRHALLSTL